ncbi:hypothetical protein EJ02DRAFT_474352 [Clathrospora elynae]|uniref:Uncharacterized protein n=1 Tax=Clathrospora elynae TaxID=706981 RepID=A0A6A5SC79_9PLEO|nr:hypothetical protein EJ02DRAFT_474352 [Clathrospora elynae]
MTPSSARINSVSELKSMFEGFAPSTSTPEMLNNTLKPRLIIKRGPSPVATVADETPSPSVLQGGGSFDFEKDTTRVPPVAPEGQFIGRHITPDGRFAAPFGPFEVYLPIESFYEVNSANQAEASGHPVHLNSITAAPVDIPEPVDRDFNYTQDMSAPSISRDEQLSQTDPISTSQPALSRPPRLSGQQKRPNRPVARYITAVARDSSTIRIPIAGTSHTALVIRQTPNFQNDRSGLTSPQLPLARDSAQQSSRHDSVVAEYGKGRQPSSTEIRNNTEPEYRQGEEQKDGGLRVFSRRVHQKIKHFGTHEWRKLRKGRRLGGYFLIFQR